MDIIDLLDSDEAELPVSLGEDFRAGLASIIQNFQALLPRLNRTTEPERQVLAACPRVVQIGQQVLAAIDASYEGRPDKAVKCFESAIRAAGAEWDFLTGHVNAADINCLFRMRSSKNGVVTREHMFHIPFELRRIVPRQRYSFAGVPCLYLGESARTCWEELRRPDLREVAVSRFEVLPENGLRLVDLSWRPAVLAAGLHEERDSNLRQKLEHLSRAVAICWSIIAACSIIPHDRDSKFVPEYLVPQLLLRWVLDASPSLDGIRYFSTHFKAYDGKRIGINYVIPARSIAARGLCAGMKQKFAMTEPTYLNAFSAGSSNPCRNRNCGRHTPSDRIWFPDENLASLEAQTHVLSAKPIP